MPECDDEWRQTAQELPTQGVEVEAINGGLVVRLVFDKALWWLPDRSMYVYYTPRVWRPLEQADA